MAGEVIERLEELLIAAARARRLLTYAQVAQALDLKPPHTIHQAAELIEMMMRLHAEAGAPQLASLIVSKARGGMPAPGFFILLAKLGLYDGPPEGEAARLFHASELVRCYEAI
jgi:hypothetical protein